MDIRVTAHFAWSEIFGRKIAARSKCQLDLSRQYSLIYADLGAEDAQGWNVLAELNKAFDIKLPAEYLRVMDAGFFTFSHFGNGAVPPNTSLHKIFPQSPVPLSVSSATEPMTNTAGFWLTVSLDDIKLFGSLIEIGYASPSGDGDKLSLSAVLARGTVAGKAVSDAIYLASLPNIRLFKLFGFEEVEVRYRFKEARQLNVKGKLRVSLFDEKQYLFEGVLNSDEVNRTFSACLKSAEPDQSVTRLFGDQMRGITFQRLVFGIFARYGDNEDQRTFQVQGTVRVGSAQLTGYIYLHNGKPQVASIKVDKALSIGDVFNQCIPGAPWPTSLIDITFKAGSELYYRSAAGSQLARLETFSCPAEGDLPDRQLSASIDYQNGFNIRALFDLTLVKTLEVVGTIQIAEDGVTADISLGKPIDLFIVTIAASRASQPIGGPAFELSTVEKKSSMGFVGSLWFMQEQFGVDVRVKATRNAKGNTQVDGTLTALSNYPPFLPAGTSLGLRYSKDGGFQVTNWPSFEYLTNAIDFIKTLQKLSDQGSAGCGKLVGFAFEKLLQSKFRVSVSFGTQENDEGVTLVLDGSYTLCVAQTSLTAVAIPFPGLVSIPLPNSISFSELGNYIERALAAAAESFVKALVKNREAIAAVIGLTAGKAAASYAATLACQALIDGVAADAVVATAAETLAAATAAEAGAGAAGALVAGAVVAVADFFSGTGTGTGTGTGGTGTGTGTGTATQSPPVDPRVTITNRVVTLTWGGGQGNARYHAQLLDSAATILLNNPDLAGAARQTQFEFGPEWPSGPYTAQVQGVHEQSATRWAAAPFNRLTAPAQPSAQADTTVPAPAYGVQLSWPPIVGASSYELSTRLPGSATDRVQIEPGADQSLPPAAYAFIFEEASPAGDYRFSVTAKGGHASVASPESEPLTLVRPGQPQDFQASSIGSNVALRWRSVAGALRYQALAQKKGAAPLVIELHAREESGVEHANFALPCPSHSPSVYQVQVWALPGADQVNYVAGVPSAVVEVTITPYATASEMATALHALTIEGSACGTQLIAAFPNLTPDTLAIAMAQGGYPAIETSNGLLAVWPDTPPLELATVLALAYPDPLQFAASQRDQGVPGELCAVNLLKAFPQLGVSEMARAMAKAGYPATDTATGLKVAYPAISPVALSTALVLAYQ